MTRQQETTNCCCFVGEPSHRVDDLFLLSCASVAAYPGPETFANARAHAVPHRASRTMDEVRSYVYLDLPSV
jgi:hypothetical protein